MRLSPIDRDLLTRTVLGEAAREPLSGQAGVVFSVLNRMQAGRYGGKDVQSVIFNKNAYEPWSTRRSELLSYSPDSPKYKRASAIVNAVLSGKIDDPTAGATHFLNEDIVRDRTGGTLPKWARGNGKAIGRHTFYAPEGAVTRVAMNEPVTDPETLKALGEQPAAVVRTPTGRAEVTDPAILQQLEGPSDGSPPPGLHPPGEPAEPILPGRDVGVGGAFVQGFASNEQEIIRHLAQSLYPNEPLEKSIQRFGKEGGTVYHVADDGTRYRALPNGVLAGLAGAIGPSIPPVAGAAAGIATAPLATTGVGLAGTIVAAGGAAGLAEAGREMAGDYMMGEAATGGLSAPQIAGQAVGSLAGQGAGAGMGAAATRGAVKDIARLDPAATQGAYQAATRAGVNITPAEATGLRTLGAQQKRLSNITPTANQMQEFLVNRDRQVLDTWGRFLNDVSPAADAEIVGRLGRDAAQGVLANMRTTLQAQAKPLYEAAFTKGDQALWSPELERLTGSPSIVSAMRGAVSKWQDNVIADGYGAMNPGASAAGGRIRFAGGKVPAFPNLQFWDYTKRALDRQIDTAKNARQGDRFRTLTRLAQQLRGELDNLAPGEYAQARSVWGTGSDSITDAMQSALGILAETADTKVLEAARHIFNPTTRSPEMVVRLRTALQNKDPAAWQGLKRLYLQDVTRQALRIAETGDVLNPAGKIHKAFMDPYTQANLRAAMSPDEWIRMRDLLVVFKRASSVPALRSDTEFNRLASEEAANQARPVLAKIAKNLNPLAFLRSVAEWRTNVNMDRQAMQVVDLVTSGDPQALASMKELRRLSPWDRRWIVLFGHLLSRSAGAGFGQLMPEADYAPNAQAN